MNRHSIFILVLLLTSLACSSPNSESNSNASANAVKEIPVPDKLLRHIVLFNFNEDADPEQVKNVEEAFVQLKSKIPEIYDLEWGLNNSPEGLDKGFTHCYLITFSSEDDRSTYLPNPDHQAFVALLDGLLEDVLVVDYWNN